MQRRACERISTSLDVRFFYSNSLCLGTVTNLSENGMCINTGMCFPCNSRIELLIPYKKMALEVSAKVSRVAKKGSFYDTMGVKLLNPPQKYLQFVDNLKSTLKS